MKRNCPEKECHSNQIVKNGSFKRINDSRRIQRFRCKNCGKQFSTSTGTLEFGQKKRRVNHLLLQLFASKVSIRRAAKIAKINKNTAARKFDYLAKKAKFRNDHFKEKLKAFRATHMQFDDLISKEKTKLKPLSVTVAVDVERRFILGAKVSQIAAFGHLAQKSKKKYGARYSNHKEMLHELFEEIKDTVHPYGLIESDEHGNYAPAVRKYFKNVEYKQYKSEKGCISGQGELKKVKHDPIFGIDHTLAMLRDNVSRLVRRTWCTTQDPQRLQGHLEIFMFYYNQIYLGGFKSILSSA